MDNRTKTLHVNRTALTPWGALTLGLLATGCATAGDTITVPETPIDVPVEAVAGPDPAPIPLFTDYRGGPEIIRGEGDGSDTLRGVVFLDLNQNSTLDDGETGLPGVKVSNGRDVAVTDEFGAYALPVRADMSVTVVQPSGYQVPHDDNWVPQISYEHKPNGTPKTLRYGGLPPTGPIPEAINFPLIEAGYSDTFGCAVLGDTQTYSNQEISYFRDSTVDDLLDLPEEARPECILAVGDVMGDDLDLIPRMAEVMSVLDAQQWWVHGNHDFDFDADFDEDSADSWRRLYGPNYYAFEIGDVLFIAIDNVVYPCSREDAETPGRENCIDSDRKRYNGRITDDQMLFIENLLGATDEDKLVVLAHHIPFVSFADHTTTAHQTDNVTELYAMLEGREALSLSGHTHTMENMSPGDSFAGWADAVGVEALPFRHIIAGAASGAWYNGDFDTFGVPMALQRLGAPRGWLDLSFNGADYVETYLGSNLDSDQRMWVSVNTPDFRSWYDDIFAWHDLSWEERDPIPPLNINDLPDVKILTPDDLAGGTYITANVWAGTTDTTVSASLAGQDLTFEHTQPAEGEDTKLGGEWADPFAVQRQLSVARWAYESRSGDERNQGWEAYKGSSFGPAAPQPQFSIANRSSHLWRARLPETLPAGVHAITVSSVDRHGRDAHETIIIEVRDERPQARFDRETFFALEDGPRLEASDRLQEFPDLIYYDGEDFSSDKHRLDLILPPEGTPVTATMLWIHGGAWAFGDRKRDVHLARAFAREGIAVANMSYRLSRGDWQGEQFSSTGVQHPEHVKDVARAFAWLHENADGYGLDNDKLFVSGFSAGGHLSALLAMDPAYLAAQNLSPADMVAALPVAGGYELESYYQAIAEGLGEDIAVGHVLGAFGPRESLPEASPISYLDGTNVPMLVLTEGQTADYTRVFDDAVSAANMTDLIQFSYYNDETHASLLGMLSQDESPARDEMVAYMEAQLD